MHTLRFVNRGGYRFLISGLPVFLLVACMTAVFSVETTAEGNEAPSGKPGRINAANEAYFYTHGPVTVFAYEYPCVVVIRDPSDGSVVDSGTVDGGQRYIDFNIPVGFYYITTGTEATVLTGVSGTRRCNGFYHYRYPLDGDAYEDIAESSEWYIRGTGGCDNIFCIFVPSGTAIGHTCCSTVCLEPCGEDFSTSTNFPFYGWSPGELYGYATVDSGDPIMVLNRDDGGYFVPPHAFPTSGRSTFMTYHGLNEYLNIHSFADGTSITVYGMNTFPYDSIWSGTLNEGETRSILRSSVIEDSWVKVVADTGTISVSVLGGTEPDDGSYMTYVLDRTGNHQGTDFITRNPGSGIPLITGLEDGTTVEIRNAETGALATVGTVDQGGYFTAGLADGTWRVRSDKDITFCVINGMGATSVPLTKNTSNSTPFPPVIAGVRWSPLHPNTDTYSIQFSWLTDELTTGVLHYHYDDGTWWEIDSPDLATEHSATVYPPSGDTERVVQFWVEATDQSGNRTVEDNDGMYYEFTIRVVDAAVEVDLLGVTYEDPHYRLQFAVRNTGLEAARNATIGVTLQGMQPFSDGVDSSYDRVDEDIITARFAFDTIHPEWTTYRWLNVMPYLSHNGPVDYAVTVVSATWDDGWSAPLTAEYPAATHDWSDTVVESRMEGTRAVVLANLSRFFDINDETNADAQEMPRAMTRYAVARNAILAYISSGDTGDIESYIQGAFYGKVSDSWFDAGYLVLVGCEQVMPAPTRRYDCTGLGEVTIRNCDQVYANTNNSTNTSPELCVARFLGEEPLWYNRAFEHAIGPIDFHKSWSVCGTGDGHSSFRRNTEDCHDRLSHRYPFARWHDMELTPSADRYDEWEFELGNTDFVYYRNHGGTHSMGDLLASDVRNNLPNTGRNPIVYANACLTGKITEYRSMAECWIGFHASAFIGASKVSNRSYNNKLGKWVTGNFKDGDSIGRAFRDGKRSFANEIHDYTECYTKKRKKEYLYMYNLFGDPMRGYGGGGAAKPKVFIDQPPSTLDINVPMYEVTSEDGIDYVSLPDDGHADETSVQNEPIVPVYRWTASYAPGIRVNDITLAGKGRESTYSGLKLPTAWGYEKTTPGPGDVPSPGWFPPEEFSWSTDERPDGGMDVTLQVYPFVYNYYIQEATFYQSWQFDLDVVETGVFLYGVGPANDPLSVGATQRFEVDIGNRGAASETVDLVLDIARESDGSVVDTLSQLAIVVPAAGTTTQTLNWPSTGFDPGPYEVIARVSSAKTGDGYDVAFAGFHLGVVDVEVLSAGMTCDIPGYVGDDEDVWPNCWFQNVGDIPLDVTAHLEIRRQSNGVLIEEWEAWFENVTIQKPYLYNELWKTSGLEPGWYEVIAWIEHDRGASNSESYPFRTLEKMTYEWSVPQDVYRPGDKIMAIGDIYDERGGVIGPADTATIQCFHFPSLATLSPTLEEHPFSPHYSTSFIVNAGRQTGPYGISGNATKAGYRLATGGCWFMVAENGFPMNPDKRICIADGISTIEVSTNVVYYNGSPIPPAWPMTVVPWGGIIDEVDVNPSLDYVQINASASRYEFTWRSPTHTWEHAFVAGLLGLPGSDYPMSGLSAKFKTIDFNDNRRVDVADIVFVESGNDVVYGHPRYDRRKDLDEDDIIDGADLGEVATRWPLEFSDHIRCSTCVPTPGFAGVIVRPVPERASVSPGHEFTVDIVVEGAHDLGGFEFGYIMEGGAVSWTGPATLSTELESTGNTQNLLGPDAYDSGFRVGAYAAGDYEGPGGTVTLATIPMQANGYGESRLIISAPILVRTDGVELSILRVAEGVYRVEDPTPTPTARPTSTTTPTETETPTPTDTMTPVPTKTPVPTDTPSATPTQAVNDTPTATATLPPTATGTPTPTATATLTPTATGTPTPTVTDTPAPSETPTVTPTAVPGDTNGDGVVNANDLFFFCCDWMKSAQEAQPGCDQDGSGFVDEGDLLRLMQAWGNQGN